MAKTILILAANPKNTPPLRLDQEIREIDTGLQRAQKRDEFILKQKFAVRPVDVRRAMLDYKPNIVHFCGHGSGEEGIAFEDDSGQAKLVGTDALSGFFELFSANLEGVVLNACYSEVQAEAIAKHISYVVGMKRAIGDAAAIEFATAFYDAIGAGESFEFAFKLACNAVQWANIPEYLTPVLKAKKRHEMPLPPDGAGLIMKPAIPDVSGRWSTQELTNPFDKNDKFRLHFDLEVKGDILLGTLRQVSTTKQYDVKNGILGGKIENNMISFHTLERAWWGQEAVTYKDFYFGSVLKGEIDFTLQSDRPWGFSPQKFVAKRG